MKKYDEALQLFKKAYKSKYEEDPSQVKEEIRREEDLVIEALFDDQEQEEENQIS